MACVDFIMMNWVGQAVDLDEEKFLGHKTTLGSMAFDIYINTGNEQELYLKLI